MRSLNKRRGQVWIETVIYTIIGLAIIGIVLGFVMPKINQSRDNVIAEQSISAMKDLDAKIIDVSNEQGNIGKVDFTIKRGYLDIDATNKSITFVVNDLSTLYSQDGVPIKNGDLEILSVKGQKVDAIYITLRYNYNITFAGENIDKKLTAAPLPYHIFIENKNNKQLDITTG